MKSTTENKPSLKHRLHEIIYEADTRGGKLFDVILLIAILASILFVMLESVQSIDEAYGSYLDIACGLYSAIKHRGPIKSAP